jgi:hypothetical protein
MLCEPRFGSPYCYGMSVRCSTCRSQETAGLIRYRRGNIKILNRAGLKESACECFESVRGHIDKAVPRLS